MKGTVVATWIQTAKKLWGEDVVAAVMEQNGWPANRIFLPLEDVDDQTIKKFIELLNHKLNIPVAQLWYEIGRDNILSFSQAYPSFFKGKNLYTEVTHVLLVSKLYYKYFEIRDKKLNDDFYNSLSSYFTYNSDFWLQYARMEMKLKAFDSAKIHLDQALTLNPSSYK